MSRLHTRCLPSPIRPDPSRAPLPPPVETPIPPADLWPILTPAQQQHLRHTLVRICRTLLAPPTPREVPLDPT